MDSVQMIKYGIFGFTQLCGLISLFVLIALISSCGGFDWNKPINVHAVLMLFGMVYLQGLAASSFRVLPFIERIIVKYTHVGIQSCVLLLSLIGLGFIVSKTEGYSLHGVLGIITFLLFFIQFFSGTYSFLYPKLNDEKREIMVPIHKFFGALIFTLSIATALTGISTYESFFILCGINGKCITAGVFALLYGIFTVFIARSLLFRPEE